HLEEAGERGLHLVDQLAEPGNQRRDAPLDRRHVEDLDHERVSGLGAAHSNGPRRRVDPFEVDRRDEIVLAADLSVEAVACLERDDVARLDLEHGLELGAESPDHVLPRDAVLGGDRAHAGATSGGISGGTEGPATPTGVSSRKSWSTLSTIRRGMNAVMMSPPATQPSATQSA